MKIGILTLPLHGNYGGILQAWALQTVLERMGHTVNVFAPKRKRQWMFIVYLKRIAHKLLGKTLEIPVFFEMTFFESCVDISRTPVSYEQILKGNPSL
ncbi:MAG: hypothetical protein K2G24_07315, partial [Muribaculaceae bacterium]|nr:hypothetical protein [Muribaculaceae bacterium]